MSAETLKNVYFPVLDHGFVALKDWMGGDDDIVEAARVSYGAGTRKSSDNRTLIRYLLRHNHTTPFEMVELKFHMKLPIFVARQLIRHRTASVNEYSGRYSLMPMLFYTPTEQDFALQSTGNRQGRGEQADGALYEAFVMNTEGTRDTARETYEHFASAGVARELARIDLPLSTYTEWYWKIDLHNLLHFLRLRADSHAQKEIRDFAGPMGGILRQIVPIAFEAWLDYRFSSMQLSWQEIQALSRPNLEFDSAADGDKYFADLGMTSRERDEFLKKAALLGDPKRDLSMFNLDLSSAKFAEFFENEAKEATPTIDSKA